MFLGALALAGTAQPPKYNVDRSKYPDYDDTFRPNWSVMVDGNKARGLKEEIALPDHWNNGETEYYPVVFNQAGGSCGPSSRIGYMLTHELNAYRHVSGKLDENRLCPNFVYPFSYDGSSKDVMAQTTGVPNIPTYGGFPYSSIYGFAESDVSDTGYMQGYDRWYKSMFNRLLKTSNFPVSCSTPEGMLAVKRYLYNHNGDESFATGGVLGLGCSAGSMVLTKIGTTDVNKALGVAGLQYIDHMGTTVDHAITLVGWDDRIEFDLDKNGVYGEEKNQLGENEKGAWILCNSWGQGWGNGGFAYFPYATASATNPPVELNGNTVYGPGEGWWPEIYTIRKDYKPRRTMKVRMTYTQRAAMGLSGGVSTNLNATAPDKSVPFIHFNYQGDADKVEGKAMMPILGIWADGVTHYEPIEFGYDLTDLCDGVDDSQPLKYFFRVSTLSSAEGTGAVYGASIIDYTLNPEGVETPFVLESDSIDVEGGGKVTTLSVIVGGSGAIPPRNLTATSEGLTWDAPAAGRQPLEYQVYKNGTKIATVSEPAYAAEISAGDAYVVRALYDIDGAEVLSSESNSVALSSAQDAVVDNFVGEFSNGGISIPDVFNSSMSQATIEFRLKPSTLTNWNQQMGPNWGTFLIHTTSAGELAYGWNTSARGTASEVFSSNTWKHVALVIDGNKITLYVNGALKDSYTSSSYSGLPAMNPFEIGSHTSNNSGLFGQLDEVRLWNYAKSYADIRAAYQYPLLNPSQYEGLMAYYKMDTIEEDGVTKLRDCIGGHHATFINSNGTARSTTVTATGFRTTPQKLSAKINAVGDVVVGQSVKFSTYATVGCVERSWVIDGKEYNVPAPTVTFLTPGEKMAVVNLRGYDDGTATDTLRFTVGEGVAPTADFRMSADGVSGDDRISYISENTMQGCTYLWELEGADVPTATTPSVSAVYGATGVYKVKLTVTTPSGQKFTETKTIEVSPAAPVADYAINPTVVVKNEVFELNDRSRYDPVNACWRFTSTGYDAAFMGLHPQVSMPQTGVYALNYSVSNAYGSSYKTGQRALIVCNADSKQGLCFNSENCTMTSAVAPADMNDTWSVAFWFKPGGTIGEGTLGINGGTGGLTIKSLAGGELVLTAGSETASSTSGYILSDWHHYAITFNKGTVYFYRDGVQFKSAKLASLTDLSSYWKGFVVGGTSTPCNGTFDEMQVWSMRLLISRIKTYCNSPLADVLISSDAPSLQLYYNFDQSSGNADDKSGNSRTGVRSGFGPDGDAWVDTKGVFSLNFNTTKVSRPLGTKISDSQRGTVIAWSDQETSSENSPAVNVLDGSTSTFWHSKYSSPASSYPHSVTIDRGSSELADIESFQFYYARATNYRASAVKVEASDDNENWTIIDESLALADESNPYVVLTSPVTQRYIRLTFLSGYGSYLALNEIYYYGNLIATGIDAVGMDAQQADKASQWYDLQGRRVSKPAQGIYVKDGKKVLVK